MKLQLQNPLSPHKVTQGWNENPEFYKQYGVAGHNGLDMQAFNGENIYAAHDGEVVFAGEDGSSGLLVVLRTLEKFDYETDGGQCYFKTLYAHIKKQGILVVAGQKVKKGQIIALADNTGLSSGSHLHFGLKPVYKGEKEWQWDNIENNNGYRGAIDPTPYLVPYKYTFSNPLKFGDKGQEVVELQRTLKEKGFFYDEPTGYYGDLTCQAVLKYQVKNVPLSWYERYVLKGTKVGIKTITAINK